MPLIAQIRENEARRGHGEDELRVTEATVGVSRPHSTVIGHEDVLYSSSSTMVMGLLSLVDIVNPYSNI